jgi:DNA-binding NarL/FixJ family response regulator
MKLSPRLMQVAELVALGYTNKRIAARLEISERTVEGYVAKLIDRVPGEGSSRYRIVAWWYKKAA